jgi:hypothetical protein
LVPWGVSFEADKDTYRSQSRKKAERESQWHELLQAMHQEKLSRLPIAPDQAAPTLTSPTGIRSKCGSTVLLEEEQNGTYPVDEIMNPAPCKL